jgi:uncharacterized protein
MSIEDTATRLIALLRPLESCVVAFSGGVDSAVVAKAAFLALGDRAVAATGIGPAVAESELEIARDVARAIGVRHVELPTDEISRPGYIANAPDRCFHCKSELYIVLAQYASKHDISAIANGTNVDDLGDYRPGLMAATEHKVLSPLVDCHLDKQAVRDLARHWNLPVWDKPAQPCLASRIAYGEQVTPERLTMIEEAERLLHDLGFRIVRVRYHEGDLARIEVPTEELPRLLSAEVHRQVTTTLKELGFRHVTVDLAGFRSGSLNAALVEIVSLPR